VIVAICDGQRWRMTTMSSVRGVRDANLGNTMPALALVVCTMCGARGWCAGGPKDAIGTAAVPQFSRLFRSADHR